MVCSCVCLCVCECERQFSRAEQRFFARAILSHLTVVVCVCLCVCFFCPLRITGMGNQWVQRLSLILQQGVNAACHLLLRECDYDIVHFSNLQLLQSCCLFTQLSSLSCPTGQSHAIRGRWRAFFFLSALCSYNTMHVSFLYSSTYLSFGLFCPCVCETWTLICCL